METVKDKKHRRYDDKPAEIEVPFVPEPIRKKSMAAHLLSVARRDQGTTLVQEAKAAKGRREAAAGRELPTKKINRSKNFFILPTRQAIAYNRQLQKSVRALVAITRKELVQAIPALIRAREADLGLDGKIRTDGVVEDTQAIARSIMAQHGASFGTAWQVDIASSTATAISDFQRRQFNKVLAPTLGIDPVLFEPYLLGELQAFTAENVALIKSINATYLRQVEQIVVTGVRGGARASTIAASIQTRFGVTSSRATLIARDQSTKFYGNLNGLRQREAGIDEYIWRTSADERVREEHEDLDGQKFKWTKPPDVGHPGQDIQCRCVAEPVVNI